MLNSPPPDPYHQAIAWADRLYSRVVDIPSESWWNSNASMEAYLAIEKRFGLRPEVRIGEGRCLVIRGQYANAVKVFGSTVPRERDEAARASRAIDALRMQVPKDVDVYQVVQISGVGWVGLCAQTIKKAPYKFESYGEESPDGFRQAEIRVLGRPTIFRPHMWDNTDPDFFRGRLLSMPLSKSESGVVMVWGYEAMTGAQQADVFEVTGNSLKHKQRFFGIYGVTAETEPNGHMLIGTCVTFKVSWNDFYEWRDGKFVFASPRYRSKFATGLHAWRENILKEDAGRYSWWASYAATCGILGKWPEAKSGWERALVCCRGCLREEAKNIGNWDEGRRYRDWGFVGDSVENLKEIRQRLRWIARKEYDHPLLYRPLDFDYQVSPYRLGKAELPDR